MNPVDLGFKPLPDTPEQRARLAQQRERARKAIAIRNGACPICENPRERWPMIHRGDRACSIQCEKTLQREEDAA